MTEADVRDAMAAGVDRHALGGVAVAVVRRARPPELFSHGWADAATQRPVTADTCFRIASISKTMTAIGLMQLWEEGRIGLDDPVNTHLKTFRVEGRPPGAGPVTVRHLLTHTAGIGEVPQLSDLVRRSAWGLGRPPVTAADLAAVYGGGLRTEVAAGTKWAYANHGFAVVGQLVEDISGVPFAEYQRQQLFDRLGMAHTDCVRTARVADRIAVGYQFRLGRLRAVKDYDFTILGAGSVLSTIADMARYAAALIEGSGGTDTAVIRADTLAAMLTPHYQPDPRLPAMGLAFFLERMGDHRVAGHDGNVPGFASSLLFAPDDGCGVVVLTNTGTALGAHLMSAAIMRSVLGMPLAPATSGVAPSPQIWPELIGHYAPAPGLLTNLRGWLLTGGEIEVRIKQRHLVVRALSPLPELRSGLRLHPTDPNDPLAFAATLQGLTIPVVFTRSGEGQVTTMSFGGATAFGTLRRRPAWRSSAVRLRALTAAAAIFGATRVRRDRRRPADTGLAERRSPRHLSGAR